MAFSLPWERKTLNGASSGSFSVRNRPRLVDFLANFSHPEKGLGLCRALWRLRQGQLERAPRSTLRRSPRPPPPPPSQRQVSLGRTQQKIVALDDPIQDLPQTAPGAAKTTQRAKTAPPTLFRWLGLSQFGVSSEEEQHHGFKVSRPCFAPGDASSTGPTLCRLSSP